MNLLGSPEFKVGILVLVVAGLISLMTIRVAQGPGVLSGNKEVYFVVENAGGLVKNSAVKMAGIKVGVIEDIELYQGKARIRLKLEGDVPLTASSRIELRSDGILGDKHVEIVPGDPLDAPVAENSEIPTSEDQAGLNDIIQEVGKIASSVQELVNTLNAATQGDGDSTTPVGRIILNLETITKDLAEVTGENKEKVNDILDRVKNITRNLDDYINEDSLARIDNSIRNIEEVTEKVNNGEGTIGRLINDDATVDKINTAIDGINEFVGGANKLSTSVDFHTEWLSADGRGAKSYLGIIVQPGLDRYYDIQLVDDPRGVTTIKETQTNDGPLFETTTVDRNRTRFTILFAKNFYNFTLSGGLIESSGGLSIDYHLMERKLTLTGEFFEFGDLYVRTFARYEFFKGFYLLGGADNLLEADNLDFSFFLGGGIFITNDDLKNLISRVSLN